MEFRKHITLFGLIKTASGNLGSNRAVSILNLLLLNLINLLILGLIILA